MARSRRGRGESGIFQRGDGYWVCSISLGYDASGKRKRRVVYGKSKKEVQDKLQSIRNMAGQPKELRVLTMQAYLTKWLEICKPTVAHETYRKREEHVRIHLVPYIGPMRLVELKRFHIEDLYARLASEGVTPAMRKKIGVTLTTALNAAVDKEMIPFNPTTRVKKPKVSSKEIHPLNGEQAQRFLMEARSDRLSAFYATILDSGARPGELFALEWLDVDFKRASITITKSLAINESGSLKAKETKTKRARRTITLARSTMKTLAQHRKEVIAEGFADGPVFPSTSGGYLHLTNVHRHSFKPILKRAKLPNIRLYDLRHTCATLLLQEGENIKVVSERLGHSTVTTTLDIYAHVLEGMQEQAAKKMETILNRRKKA